jgi:hypothetical protein
MKKRHLSGLFLISIVLLIALSSYGTAWSNGAVGYTSNLRSDGKYLMCANWAQFVKRPPEEPVSCYRRFYLAGDSAWYSTHDYIAHFAVDYLCASDPSGKYNWLKDSNQRYFYIYLLATEYPDYGDDVIIPDLILEEGRFNVKNYFIKSHSFTKKSAASAASTMSCRAVKNLNHPYYRWEITTFCLGIIAHYIGDLAFPPHILRPFDPSFNNWLKNRVSRYTTLEDYQQNNKNRFFTINLERILGYTPDKLNILNLFTFLPDDKFDDIIYFIAEMMAFTTLLNLETFFNFKVANGSWSTSNLYNFYREKGHFDFDNVERNDPNFIQFFDRIEEILNWAVYWTAAALKVILDQYDGKKDTENRPSLPDPNSSERTPPFNTADFLVRFGPMIMALTALGLIREEFRRRFGI